VAVGLVAAAATGAALSRTAATAGRRVRAVISAPIPARALADA
jgi:hypothetical protein